MNILCQQVKDQYGNLHPQSSTLVLQESTKIFRLNNRQIEYNLPIALQLYQGGFYVFLNNEDIVAVSSQYYGYVNEALRKLDIGCIKVPNKQIQTLAAQLGVQNTLIHCGTFNFEHDCFAIVRLGMEKLIQIRNSLNCILFQSFLQYMHFDDGKQAINMESNTFYFWKRLQYEEIKYRIGLRLSKLVQIEENYGNSEMEAENKIQEEEQVQKSHNLSIEIENHQTPMNKQEQNIKFQQKVEVASNENILQYTTKKQPKTGINITDEKKTKCKRRTYEMEDDKQNNHMNDNSTREIHPIMGVKLNFQNSYETSRNQKIENNQQLQMEEEIESQEDEQMIDEDNSNKGKEGKEVYKQVNTLERVVCCQDKYNVYDIRIKDSQPFLFYNKFKSEQEQSKCCQIAKLNPILEGDQQLTLKPSKLIFDINSQILYYNNLNESYIHSYDTHKSKQESYYVCQPIIDMVQLKKQNILCLSNNKVFLFDTRECKRNVVANYKTVRNLTHISAIQEMPYFVTASSEGFIRTYDIRNHYKALNKFQMPTGITSLEISKKGNYILCAYDHKVQILSTTDRLNQSIFSRRTKLVDRKKVNELIKGYQNLSHIQFLSSGSEGDIIAVDDLNIENVVMKNVMLITSSKNLSLHKKLGRVQYLNSVDNWLVYGKNGTYYRQQILWYNNC